MNREGQKVPQVTFRTRNDGQWGSVTTDEIFNGRNVIVFALPGAYTPTCSTTHLPRYNELAATFSKLGIDEIVCLSVNDPFVMTEWQKDQDAPEITFIADGKKPGDAHPPAFATFEDGYRANCIVEAILDSAKKGSVWTAVKY